MPVNESIRIRQAAAEDATAVGHAHVYAFDQTNPDGPFTRPLPTAPGASP
jgi:hypothetical protein